MSDEDVKIIQENKILQQFGIPKLLQDEKSKANGIHITVNNISVINKEGTQKVTSEEEINDGEKQKPKIQYFDMNGRLVKQITDGNQENENHNQLEDELYELLLKLPQPRKSNLEKLLISCAINNSRDAKEASEFLGISQRVMSYQRVARTDHNPKKMVRKKKTKKEIDDSNDNYDF